MVSRLALCLVLPCVLGVFSGTTAVSAQDPVPVVIDSDMISDDWMATLFVLNDPQFRCPGDHCLGHRVRRRLRCWRAAPPSAC